MDDKQILKYMSKDFLNLKNYIYEGVTSATFAIIKKDIPQVIHYESTNQQWKRFYSNFREAKACHIMNMGASMAKKQDEFSLIWNFLPPTNEESEYINAKRIDLKHSNGISMCKNLSDNILFCALLSGPEENKNFVSFLLQNKRLFLDNLFNKIIID